MLVEQLDQWIEILISAPTPVVADDIIAFGNRPSSFQPAEKLTDEEYHKRERELLIKFYTNDFADDEFLIYYALCNIIKDKYPNQGVEQDLKLNIAQQEYDNSVKNYHTTLLAAQDSTLHSLPNYEKYKIKIKGLLEGMVETQKSIDDRKNFLLSYRQNRTKLKQSVEKAEIEYLLKIQEVMNKVFSDFDDALSHVDLSRERAVIVGFEDALLSLNILDADYSLILTCARIAFLKYRLALIKDFDKVYDFYKMNDVEFYAAVIIYFAYCLSDIPYDLISFQLCLNKVLNTYNKLNPCNPYQCRGIRECLNTFLVDLGVLDKNIPSKFGYSPDTNDDDFDRADLKPEQTITSSQPPQYNAVARDLLGVYKLATQFKNIVAATLPMSDSDSATQTNANLNQSNNTVSSSNKRENTADDPLIAQLTNKSEKKPKKIKIK